MKQLLHVVFIFFLLFFGFHLGGIKNGFPQENSIEILKRLSVRISPEEGGGTDRFLESPLRIWEGINGEIIFLRGNYLEIFTPEGKPITRIGRTGQGPGEFNFIFHLKKSDSRYFILDSFFRMNLFDSDFNYLKRFFLSAEGSTRIIRDFDIEDDNLVTVQRMRTGELKSSLSIDDNVMMLYSKEGLFKKAFFKQKEGWDIHPDVGILGGNILLVNDQIYFAYSSINKIWKLNNSGRIIKNIRFGEKSWQSIHFSKKIAKKRKELRSENIEKYYDSIYSSGDFIKGMNYYKEKILIRASRDVEEKAVTLFYLLDLNLQNERGPFVLDGYHLSGVGEKYLYFTKYVSEYSINENMDIEVLISKIDFR